MRIKNAIIVLLLAGLMMTACSTGSQNEPVKVANVKTPLKEVQVLDLSNSEAEISFSKSSVASSKDQISIFPETSGKVVAINYKVGDTVRKGDTIVVLGDSSATKVADIQSDTAQKGFELAEQSQGLTNTTAMISQNMAYSGQYASLKSLQNSITTKEDADEIYEEQLDGAEIGKDMAKDAKDTAIQAGMGVDQAKAAVDQAKNAIDLLKKSHVAQDHQLDFAMQMAVIQYQNAIRQWELSLAGAGQQNIGAEMQVLQAESGAKMAQVSRDAKYVKSPIAGVITSISAEKNNMAAPGMPLVTVENTGSLVFDTSLNPYESTLVRVGDKVIIESDTGSAEGEISWISPSANSMTKKIDLEILIPDPKNITPGTLAKATFSANTDSKIFVPINSVYNNEGKHFVKIVEGKKIAYRNVEIGEITGDYAEITSGLNGTEKVATSSELFLSEGEEVKIAKNK